MTTLSLVARCDRCRRYHCSDRRSCDEVYIRLLEERMAHWQHIAGVLQERVRIDNKMWQDLRRGGRGRPLPGEAS
jgi:hypothetical protein